VGRLRTAVVVPSNEVERTKLSFRPGGFGRRGTYWTPGILIRYLTVEVSVNQIANYLAPARRILIFTGAGISTGSGIPDFRGPGGVWTRRQPVYYEDFMTSELARIEHWDYKLEAWAAFRFARPNAVHDSIVRLEKAGMVLAVMTQNIDGLHSMAGTTEEHLIELHGTNARVECQSCHRRSDPGPAFEFFRVHRKPPLCECGGFLKPATISFGQSLDPHTLKRVAEEADLVVALGSTLSVYPAAGYPLMAAQRDVPYLIINRGATDHDGQPCVSLRLEGDVTSLFPPAVDAVCGGLK
jgi:NAD-dependent deacetylase